MQGGATKETIYPVVDHLTTIWLWLLLYSYFAIVHLLIHLLLFSAQVCGRGEIVSLRVNQWRVGHAWLRRCERR